MLKKHPHQNSLGVFEINANLVINVIELRIKCNLILKINTLNHSIFRKINSYFYSEDSVFVP